MRGGSWSTCTRTKDSCVLAKPPSLDDTLPVAEAARPAGMLSRAAEQARLLDEGWLGPEHFLLALLVEPSDAADALADAGVTHQRLADQVRSMRSVGGAFDPKVGSSPNPAANRLMGCAIGFAAASGERQPAPRHWLLAMLYVDDRVAMHLHSLGVSAAAVLGSLRSRGVSVPDVEPHVYRPWRGSQFIEIDEPELEPALDLLGRRHPPGSEWQWGFNWLPGEPRRAIIHAEAGIALDAIVVEARRRLPH